jgi:hypothetical protein
MSKVLKGLLLGAAVGAAAAVIESYSKDRPVNELARNAALWGAGGAAAGAGLGMALGGCGRCRKKKAGPVTTAVKVTKSAARAQAADAALDQLRRAEALTRSQRKAAMRAVVQAKAKAHEISRAERRAAHRAAAQARAKVHKAVHDQQVAANHAIEAASAKARKFTRAERKAAHKVARQALVASIDRAEAAAHAARGWAQHAAASTHAAVEAVGAATEEFAARLEHLAA